MGLARCCSHEGLPLWAYRLNSDPAPGVSVHQVGQVFTPTI